MFGAKDCDARNYLNVRHVEPYGTLRTRSIRVRTVNLKIAQDHITAAVKGSHRSCRDCRTSCGETYYSAPCVPNRTSRARKATERALSTFQSLAREFRQKLYLARAPERLSPASPQSPQPFLARFLRHFSG